MFVLRGRRGGLIKVLWHDGQGMCLFAKRLERVAFAIAAATLTNAGHDARLSKRG